MTAHDAQKEYVLRSANAGDLQALLDLQEASHGAPHWSAAIWSDVLLARAGRAVFILELADGQVGFIAVSAVADVAELESIAVAKEHRGRGLGRVLCERGLAWAAAAGAGEMLLEVRASNVAAIRLYRRLGFMEQRARRNYYAAPVEDALMMARSLGTPELRGDSTL